MKSVKHPSSLSGRIDIRFFLHIALEWLQTKRKKISMAKYGLPLETRFWMKVDKKGEDECWNWIPSPTPDGYGNLCVRSGKEKKFIYAHRYSYELHNGLIPEGLCVCHTCDNRRCCNPKHFFLGTKKDNNLDAKRKGRMYVGGGWNKELSNGSKLTIDQVKEIKIMLANGVKSSIIAKMFSVSGCVICHIKKGRMWSRISIDDQDRQAS